MPKRSYEEFRAMVAAKRELQAVRFANAAELLLKHQIIDVNERGRETFMLLHPSTVIPNGWQVSLFDRSGPFSHEEGEDQAKVIERALEMRDLSDVRPVSEKEFMAISMSSEFVEGVKRVTYTGLWNRITYEYGYDIAEPYVAPAREATSLDEAITILQAGLEELHKQAPSRRGR
jgi:hypothetical protein